MQRARVFDLLWRHRPGTTGITITASDTGLSIQEVVEAIRPALEADGIRILVREEEYDGDEVLEVNGQDLYSLLERVREGDLYCRARSRREELALRRHPLADDELPAGQFTEFMMRKALLLAIEGED